MWISNAVMYVTVPYNKVLFPILYSFNQPIGVLFWSCPRIFHWWQLRQLLSPGTKNPSYSTAITPFIACFLFAQASV